MPEGLELFEELRESPLLDLRFEKNPGMHFDWDDDGNLDDGSRLPEMIEHFGFQDALHMMAAAFRVHKDLIEGEKLFDGELIDDPECHCTEEQKWSDGFDL
ncbi:hypothetical protein IWX49DRAFT_587337 [Phyllosticta citricarpa]